MKSATVFVFLSETCPICQSYTLPLKEIYKKYEEKNVSLIGVFPNYYVNQQDIDAFKKTYSIPFDLVLDNNGVLCKKLKATITLEVFVENNFGEIIYSGRIDDSFYAIGKRRNVATTFELVDALNAFISNRQIKTIKTQAVGCIISSSK